MHAHAVRQVRHLVVTLEECDEVLWSEAKSRRSAALLLPWVILTLVQESVLGSGYEFLWLPPISAEIRFVVSRQRDERRMMKIVVPHRVDAEVSHQPGVLRFVFRDDDDRSRGRCVSGPLDDLGDEVAWGFVEDVLRRVESKSIEMELVDPVSGVRDRKLPDASRAFAVIVDRFAPLGGASVHVRVG